jgi:hypothetical protein
MFGRDWEPVVGTVVDKQYRGSRRYGSGPLSSPSYKYVVEVSFPDGETLRQELDDFIGTRALSVEPGARVALLCHGKHRSLKWDESDALLKVARGIGVTTAERRASGYLNDEQWAAAVRTLHAQADSPNPASTKGAAPAVTDSKVAAPDIADQLAKLAQLRQQGMLTDAEFEAAKQQLLSP